MYKSNCTSAAPIDLKHLSSCSSLVVVWQEDGEENARSGICVLYTFLFWKWFFVEQHSFVWEKKIVQCVPQKAKFSDRNDSSLFIPNNALSKTGSFHNQNVLPFSKLINTYVACRMEDAAAICILSRCIRHARSRILCQNFSHQTSIQRECRKKVPLVMICLNLLD